jgi:hypothetical protein
LLAVWQDHHAGDHPHLTGCLAWRLARLGLDAFEHIAGADGKSTGQVTDAGHRTLQVGNIRVGKLVLVDPPAG